MSFATDLLHTLEHAMCRQARPRVRALHLPPAQALASSRAEFCALELDDGALGMSYVLLDDALGGLLASDRATADLIGVDALTLARGYAGDNSVLRDMPPAVRHTLGFAAAHALSRSVMNRIGFVPPPASDSIGGIDPQRGDHVGMIGLFAPLLKQVTAAGARLTVIELRADWAGDYDGYRVTTDASALRQCNKVLSTSTVLLNHSVDRMLEHCSAVAHLAVIGPGAGCLPEPLFARGVSLIGGSWITAPDAFIDALRRGESWSAFAFKFAMRTADWPGVGRAR